MYDIKMEMEHYVKEGSSNKLVSSDLKMLGFYFEKKVDHTL